MVHAKSLQSCLTPCDPMDHSPPSSSVDGILQARVLEWVAMPSSRGSGRRFLYHQCYLGSLQILLWLYVIHRYIYTQPFICIISFQIPNSLRGETISLTQSPETRKYFTWIEYLINVQQVNTHLIMIQTCSLLSDLGFHL